MQAFYLRIDFVQNEPECLLKARESTCFASAREYQQIIYIKKLSYPQYFSSNNGKLFKILCIITPILWFLPISNHSVKCSYPCPVIPGTDFHTQKAEQLSHVLVVTCAVYTLICCDLKEEDVQNDDDRHVCNSFATCLQWLLSLPRSFLPPKRDQNMLISD